MRSRVLTALFMAGLAAALLAGCGDDSEGASGGNSTKELASTPGAGGSDSSSDSGSDSGSSDGTDVTLPDLGDVSIPDMSEFGDLGECMNQATAYASLAMSALGGDDAAATAESALEQMKSSLPADLQDDIEVLAAGYQKVAQDGFIAGGEAMDTPEFKKADQAISDYFEETCGG